MFRYDDYRTLLGDYYVEKKRAQPHFSYRAFSRRTGFRAPNHLHRVIKGIRNLSPLAASHYARAMHLDDEEARYFCALVELGRASDEKEVKRWIGEIDALKRRRKNVPTARTC